MKTAKRAPIEYDNLLFCLSIVFNSVISLVNQTIRRFVGNTGKLDTLLMYGLLLLLIFKILPRFRKMFNAKDLIFFFLLAMAFLAAAVRSVHDSSVSKTVIASIFTSCLPVYIGAKLVHDSPQLNLYLRISACVVLVNVLANTYIFHSGALSGSYSQYDGYVLLTGMTLLLVPLVSEHTVFDIAVAGIMLLATLLTGARGPFLIGAILFVLGMFLMNRGKKLILLLYAILIAAAVIVYRNMQKILLLIASVFGNSGSLRTINSLLNHELTNSGSRIRLMENAWAYIENHMLIGCGVVNDRVILYHAMPELGEAIGSYPHNFFFEIGMQFGLVFGILLCCLLAWTVIKRYMRCTSLRGKLLVIAMFFAGFAPLMLSGSYLDWAMFYAFLGFVTRSDDFGGMILNEQNS